MFHYKKNQLNTKEKEDSPAESEGQKSYKAYKMNRKMTEISII